MLIHSVLLHLWIGENQNEHRQKKPLQFVNFTVHVRATVNFLKRETHCVSNLPSFLHMITVGLSHIWLHVSKSAPTNRGVSLYLLLLDQGHFRCFIDSYSTFFYVANWKYFTWASL